MNRYVWPIAMDIATVPDVLGKKQMGVCWPLLYDIEAGTRGNDNIINTYPEKAVELRAIMAEWRKKTGKDTRGFGRGG